MNRPTYIVAECARCTWLNYVDPIHVDVTDMAGELAVVWPCAWCEDGYAIVARPFWTAVLTSGAKIQPEALQLVGRTHGPLL